jgi:hypothetical protein
MQIHHQAISRKDEIDGKVLALLNLGESQPGWIARTDGGLTLYRREPDARYTRFELGLANTEFDSAASVPSAHAVMVFVRGESRPNLYSPELMSRRQFWMLSLETGALVEKTYIGGVSLVSLFQGGDGDELLLGGQVADRPADGVLRFNYGVYAWNVRTDEIRLLTPIRADLT